MSSVVVSGDTSGSITISAPAISGTNTLTLPAVTDTLVGLAATQTLTNKTLTTPNLGTPSTLVLTNATGLAAAAMPAGSVLQVVQGLKTDSTSFTTIANTYTDVPGQGGSGVWSVSITPSSASNKILIHVMCSVSCNFFGATNRLMRDSTAIAVGDVVVNTHQATTATSWNAQAEVSKSVNISYLDSPSTTSATTYKMQVRGAAVTYFNRPANQTTSVDNGNTVASIVAMEIKG